MSRQMPDLTTAPPWYDRATTPTRREVAEWLAVTSDANRDAWFDARNEDSLKAAHCWEMDHDAVNERLTTEVRNLRERVRWLEKNYQAGKTVIRLHRTFPDGTHALDCEGCKP